MSPERGPPLRRLFAAAAVAGLVAFAACARPQAPTGGPVPEQPPQVVRATPAHLSSVDPFDGPVEIRFDRTLSERVTSGASGAAVVVSPQTGDVAVETSGETVRISMEGGFSRSTIYRITILPRFQDRYQNALERPYDLVFSTGPELEPNLLAGLVTDRLTLEPAADVRVDAVDGEGIAHSTVTDTAGIFALPYLPTGDYRVGAYEDTNRDRTAGFLESQDSAAVTVSAGDTLLVTDLEILQPDTTAAVLSDVVVVDSVTLRAVFDDPIDPAESLDGVEVTVEAVGGGATVPVTEILHPWQWDERRAETAAAAQAAGAAGQPGVPAQPDDPTPGAAADPQAPDPGGPAGADPGAADPAPSAADPNDTQDQTTDGPPLPEPGLIILLGLEMGVGTPWEVMVSGVGNLNGVPGGGGAVEVVREAAPAPNPGIPPGADQPAGTPDPADSPAGDQPTADPPN